MISTILLIIPTISFSSTREEVLKNETLEQWNLRLNYMYPSVNNGTGSRIIYDKDKRVWVTQKLEKHCDKKNICRIRTEIIELDGKKL